MPNFGVALVLFMMLLFASFPFASEAGRDRQFDTDSFADGVGPASDMGQLLHYCRVDTTGPMTKVYICWCVCYETWNGE